MVAAPVEELLTAAVLARLDSTQLSDALAGKADTTAVYELAGTGGALREQWAALDIDRQQAIVKSVLDHAVIAPSTPGSRTLDISRVQPHWRVWG